MARQKGVKEICANRKAFHEYFVLERFEAGIELAGTEVKSVRGGNVNLKDSFCTVKDGEYFKDSRVKVELGLCKGKKLHDKRDSEADREAKRDIDRAMKERIYQ